MLTPLWSSPLPRQVLRPTCRSSPLPPESDHRPAGAARCNGKSSPRLVRAAGCLASPITDLPEQPAALGKSHSRLGSVAGCLRQVVPLTWLSSRLLSVGRTPTCWSSRLPRATPAPHLAKQRAGSARSLEGCWKQRVPPPGGAYDRSEQRGACAQWCLDSPEQRGACVDA